MGPTGAVVPCSQQIMNDDFRALLFYVTLTEFSIHIHSKDRVVLKNRIFFGTTNKFF